MEQPLLFFCRAVRQADIPHAQIIRLVAENGKLSLLWKADGADKAGGAVGAVLSGVAVFIHGCAFFDGFLNLLVV